MNQKRFVNVAIIIGIVSIVCIVGYLKLSRPTVSLGEGFVLIRGGVAHIKGLDVSLEVKDFINAPCPKGSQCIWNGQGVVYELTVDGKIYGSSVNPPYEAPYEVLIKKTDYTTYAIFVINKAEGINDCANKSGQSQEWCWEKLARRLNNQVDCSKSSTVSGKDSCFEYMAVQAGNNNLCENVLSPKGYCLYLKLVSQDTLAQCDSIGVYTWRVSCFIDIAQKRGLGEDMSRGLPGACAGLDADNKVLCIKEYFGLTH